MLAPKIPQASSVPSDLVETSSLSIL
jgi:hypothetical protein